MQSDSKYKDSFNSEEEIKNVDSFEQSEIDGDYISEDEIKSNIIKHDQREYDKFAIINKLKVFQLIKSSFRYPTCYSYKILTIGKGYIDGYVWRFKKLGLIHIIKK